MNHELKDYTEINTKRMPLNITAGKSIQGSGPSAIASSKVLNNQHRAHLEDFILSEFDIDSETMEEHFRELLLYIMHNKLIEKIPQD